MTRDQPDAKGLLETARRVLKEDILPRTPSDETLNVLMVVRAMEIAGRVLGDSSDALEDRQRARLERLAGSGGDAATLAARIHDGDWDADADARALHAVLDEDARDRLARINPKYLALVESEEHSGRQR